MKLPGCIAVTALLTLASPAMAGPTYQVIDLGAPFEVSVAFSVNESGQVAVNGYNGFITSAHLYSAGSFTNIGTLGGINSTVSGINNAGQLTGISQRADSSSAAFITNGGVMTEIGVAGGGTAINDAGQVAGYTFNGHAFQYSGGTVTIFGTLGGSYSEALAINSAGDMAGDSALADENAHAVLYSNGVMTDIDMVAGRYSQAFGINDAKDVVGIFAGEETGFLGRAFAYGGGALQDLGVLGTGTYSSATDINNLGQIVGESATLNNNDYHAFLYQNGVMTDLNSLIDPSSGWVLQSAQRISDSGYIVGYGNIGPGRARAFLLKPLAAVPEPASWALMIMGFSLTGATMRRRTVRVAFAV